MAKKFNMTDFLHKKFMIFWKRNRKKTVASRKKSKWRQYSRWRQKCSYLSPNIFKNDIFVCFSLVFLLFWVKIKIFMEKLFSRKFKMAE
jgi:hypothetical protein